MKDVDIDHKNMHSIEICYAKWYGIK